MMKASIRIKIMGALFLIALLTFVPMFYLAYIGMKRFLFTSVSIGDVFLRQIIVENDTERNKHYLGFLRRLTAAQTDIMQLQLEQVAGEVHDIADDLQSGKNNYSGSIQCRTSEASVPPQKDKFAALCFAPETRPSIRYGSKVRSQLNSYASLLRNLQRSSCWIEHAILICNNGVQIAYPWFGFPDSFNGKETAWFKNAAAANGKTIWFSSQTDFSGEKENVLICACAWYDAEKVFQGAVAAEVPVNSVIQHLENLCKEENLHFLLLDFQGTVLAKDQISISDQQYKVLWQKISTVRTGNCRLAFGKDDKMFVFFAPVPICDCYLAIYVPEKQMQMDFAAITERYNQRLKNTKNLFFDYVKEMVPLFGILALILLCFVLYLGYFLAKQLTRPIHVLARKAAHMGEGHLSSRLHIHTGDEVEILANALNRMADNLKAYIRNMNQAARERQIVESELQAAAEIQKSMLPSVLPPLQDIELYAFMKPAREVGGDMYDFAMLDENRLFFMVGDVSGKGMPAALFMASAKTLMCGCACSGMSPAEILLNTNNVLAEKNDSCMFITAFCGIYDRSTGLLVYANAGHNQPLHQIPGGHCEYMDLASGFPLGPMTQTRETYQENSMYLLPGEALFIYTDGATEALDRDLNSFGKDRLKDTVNLYASLSAEECVTKTVDIIFAYMKDLPQSDDLTVLMLRKKEAVHDNQ